MGYGVFEELEKLRKQQEAARSKYGNTTKRTVTPVPEDTDYGVFNELRKLQEVDKLREERQTILSSNLGSKKKDDDEDIAPVREDKQEEEEERTWFQRGAFEDGFSLKNTAKAIIGSAEDVIENVGTGIAGMGEKIVDALAWAAPYVAQGQYYQNGGVYQSLDQQKQFEKNIAQAKADAATFIQKDLYDEEKLVKQIYSNNTLSKRLLNADPDDLSVFGEKSDALAQSTGQLAATAALSAVGVPWFLTTGATSFGGEVENALNQGATMEEAGLSGFITAGAEILTEKISGGIKFGGKTLDEGLTKVIARSISDKTARTLVKLGFDAAGEGFEEVLSGAISAVGQRIAYDDDKDISLDELFFSEEAFESFVGGAVMGGGFSTINAIKAKKNGVDYVTELTTNEQKVVDKEYKDRVAEAEKNGKVSQSEKSEIYDRVLKDMEKGYISTDSIEAALGGDAYNNYRSTTASENNILKEFEELGKKQNPTLSETHRYNELVEQVKEIKGKKAGEQLKTKLSEEVKNLVTGDRLVESYNERTRRTQAFEADLSQYDEKQQAVVKKAVDSGILNNTNRTHEFVDMVAKISADKGVLFDFTNNAKLKESGFALNGATVNGYKTADGIVVNVDSAKSRNFVVGHEITHVLEGTELYGELQKAVFDYAKTKGEYDSRLASVTELYKKYDPEADPLNELTSDLVGEYVFSDPDFINNLSTEHRNVFQKVYDEIKYLLKVATAGSKEARELERVKKVFEAAYRADNKATAQTQYHVSDNFEAEIDKTLRNEMNKSSQVKARDFTPEILVKNGVKDLPMLITQRHIKTTIYTEAEAKELGLPTGGNNHYHGLGKELLVKAIDNMDDPLEIYKQDGDHYLIITEMQNSNGDNIIIPVKIDGKGNYNDVYIDENQIKSVYGKKNLQDYIARNNFQKIYEKKGIALNEGVQFSNISDSSLQAADNQQPASNMKLPQNGDDVKKQFSLSDTSGREVSPAVAKRFGNSKAVDESGNLKVLYHGTPSGEFSVFDKAKGSVEGDFGSGFYFTDNEGDVTNNYEGGGPDFDNKVARRAEQIEQEEDIDYEEAEERAREELYKGSHKFQVYLNVENPAVVGETMLFDNESYLEQYNEEDYEDYDDYIADVEQNLADDIENIIWEVEKNVDVYSTDGLADVLYNAYYEGGIGIEELKAKINELYLEDSEGNLVGNEVTRQIIESLGYDGIIDPTVSSKFNMDLEEGTTHYIVFKPNQIKAITNQNPTDNPDIHRSLSDTSTPQRHVSDPLTDLRLEGLEDIAPVVETQLAAENSTGNSTGNSTTKASVEELFPDDTAPIQEEYENLLAEREDIKGAMDAFAAVGNYDSAEQLMAEYEAVQARIAEIEADDADRFASIDDADAPLEVDSSNPEDVADNVPLTKVLVNNLAKQVKSQLGLGNNRTAEVRELIERYSNEEFPSKAHLYTEIQERFGTITETEVDEDLKGIKALLRTYGINVDDSIKAEIPDYAQLMRSNFGKVRFSKEGLPVDVAYKEFQESLPGYFPESIYVPTDQLMRIIEVANMDTTMETEYEIDWQTLEGVTDTIMNGVAEFKQNRKESLANKHGRESFQSLMEDADQYVPPIPENVAPASFSIAEDTAPVRPAIESVQAEPDDIAPVFETSSGQQSILPEVEVPKKLTRKDLHFNIMDQIKTYFRNKGSDFDKVLKDAKDLSTFATVDNTPQRVLEKALGYKEGQMLSEMTVNRVARNETEGIKWLNSFTDKKSGLLAKISKQYGIKPGSKASAAAQMYAEGFYVGENDAIIAYGDKELAADFPDKKVQANIKKLARDPRIRQIYDETLAAINKSRTRNAYPEIPRLDNYFLHFRAMEDTFSRMGLPFNPNDIRAKDLPTDLNGVTADLKPGQPYFASAMHRTGKRTSFDLLGGLEKYLTSAKNQIYHIDDIQTFRALRNYVAETYGQANGLKDLDLLSDEEAEQRIKDVYDSHLSTFAKFLNEEANVLAGKTSLIDRGLEGVIGRRGITFLDTLNKQVGSNMVGFNVSSSLTNFLAPVQAFAKTNKFDFVKAMAQTAHNKLASVVGKGDSFAEESPVMIRRKGAERFYRTPYQKVADAGYVLMGVVDDISTELIARTKYNEFTRKGMDSQKAHYETDKWVSRLMGDRSLGQQPQLYNSKMLGLFTKFQLEVRNQLDSQFYDTIQEAKVSTEEIENKLLRNAKKAAKITSTFAQLAVMQHLFGKAFESVAGYNPAFDIIEALIKTFGWDDEEKDEDTVLDNIEEGFLSLLGDLPYTSTLTGGRIPIASALPVTQFIKGEDQYGNEKSRWQTLGEAAPYYVLPGGYGQIKKTKAGMEMFDEDLPIAGSYTDSGNLRFPVEDTTGNRVQAALFGQWASENARDYFDNERKPLGEKQIQEFIDSDMPIRDYWNYREGLAEHEKLADKADYIDSLDLPISTKNMLVNNVAGRKEPIDMADYGRYGSLEEMDFATKNPEKYMVALNIGGYARYMGYQAGMKDMKLAEKADYISKLDLTVAQKNLLINSETDRKEPIDLTGYENFSNFEEFEFAKKNPEAYAMAKTVGGYEAYTEYSDALGDIKADKDKFGKSISGTRKTKVVAYINSLNIPVTQKYILLKSEYPSTDDYNYEIIDYVNSMDDMTFEEKIEVLRKLDFDVDAAGNIYW